MGWDVGSVACAAVTSVHCCANAFIACKALHLSMHHAEHVFYSNFSHAIDHSDTYPVGTVVNLKHPEGTVVPAQIQGQRGTDYSITSEASVTLPWTSAEIHAPTRPN